jgi:hypothetical protein
MMTANATIETATVPQRQLLALRLAEVFLIVLVFFALAGDPPPNVNESHYLCRLKHYWNPNWCAGDLFLESTDTQTIFIWIFGWITRFVSLPAAAWIGRILAWTLQAWAWQRLSWRILPTPFASVLSAALFVTLNARAQLAGEWVIGGVEAKCFAYGFVLLALRELVDQRWNRMWLLLGVAAAFHPLVGGWSAVVCAGLSALQEVRSNRSSASPLLGRVPWLGIIGGALLASLGVAPALSLTWNEPADVVAEASRIYVFERLPHHLALLALPPEEITARLSSHGMLLVALTALGIGLRHQAVFRVVQFAWGAAVLALVGLTIELTFSHEQLFAARLLRFYWYLLTDFAAPMAVAFATTSFATGAFSTPFPVRGRPGTGKSGLAMVALLAAFLFPAWHFASIMWQRLLYPIPPADVRMADYEAWTSACDWVAENTSAGALFLTPRLNHSFKWRTGRPEVVNRKDIPQDARGIIEWNRRIKEIYYYENETGLVGPIDSLGQLGTERVRELAREYNADFILSDRGQLLGLPRAYWNEEYVVYRVEDRSAGHSR